jgi:hypothetical protein
MLGPVRRAEATFAVALAVLAAGRVLVFAAAFPPFSNVDEHRHIDVALKYARGYLPRPETNAYEPELPTLTGTWRSPEYYMRPWERGQAGPPAWERGPEAVRRAIESDRDFFERRTNLEAYQPPVHYALTGAWIRVGRALGLGSSGLLYWMRGLNGIFIALLSLASYLFLRDALPDDPERPHRRLFRLGVPVLLVAFPLDVFYYVTQDALSPLLFAVGFFGAARLARSPQPGWGAYAALGAVASAALLTKYTSLALVAVYAFANLHALRARSGARSLRGEGGRWLVAWLLLLLPVAIWFARNQLLFDDPLGTRYKTENMGWGQKSLSEIWDHPIFTPGGFSVFVGDLVPRFWRGQLAWYRTTLASPVADTFYLISTVLMLAAAAFGLRWGRAPKTSRPLELQSWIAVLGSVAMLAVLSLLFVYTEKSDPSLARPYFSHGRLISGALVPFLLLYLRGIQVATSPLPPRVATFVAWGLVALVVCVSLVSEAMLSREVFASRYNWFHLP